MFYWFFFSVQYLLLHLLLSQRLHIKSKPNKTRNQTGNGYQSLGSRITGAYVKVELSTMTTTASYSWKCATCMRSAHSDCVMDFLMIRNVCVRLTIALQIQRHALNTTQRTWFRLNGKQLIHWIAYHRTHSAVSSQNKVYFTGVAMKYASNSTVHKLSMWMCLMCCDAALLYVVMFMFILYMLLNGRIA